MVPVRSMDPSIVAPSNINGNKKNTQIYCIEGMPKTFKQLEMTKAALGYGNDEFLTNMVANIDLEEDGFHVSLDDPIGAMMGGKSHWSKTCRKEPDKCVVVPSDSIDNWINLAATDSKTKQAPRFTS